MAKWRVTFEVETPDHVDPEEVEAWVAGNLGMSSFLSLLEDELEEDEVQGERITVQRIE